MSFGLTSRSIIRFESSPTRLGDECQRTLTFFNVDISRGVHCDHRNEITAPRTQDRNGKRPNPVGELSNRIMECAMPFGKQNECYSQRRDEFDHRRSRPRRRSLGGGRRKNSSYAGSCRRLQYWSTKPMWNHPDAAPFSYCPTTSSTHRYANPDYETANGYDEGYNKRYQNEEYKLPHQISRDVTYPEEARDSRDCCGTDSSYESPADYYPNGRLKRGSYQRNYETPPHRNCCSYYTEELSCNDFSTNGWDSLSQLNIFRPRGTRGQRQASGSMLPEYPLDCNEMQPPSEFGRKVRYSPLQRFGYEDYGEKGLRSAPLPSPKPKPIFKIRNECRAPYKAFRDKGFSIIPSRSYKTETHRFRNMDFPDKLSSQTHEPGSRNGIRLKEPQRCHISRSLSGSCRRNRSRRHFHLEKVPLYGAPFNKAREASAQYNRISKQSLNLGTPKMHEATGAVPRETPDQRVFNFIVEEIPHPYQKSIKKEVPVSNFHFDIHDEIPRHQRKLEREPVVTFANISSSKTCANHERKTYVKPSPDKNKLFDFGSEVPYRLWNNIARSPMLIAYDIPYKKKDRTNDLKSDLDNDCSAVPYSSSAAKLKEEKLKKPNGPRVSLYDIKKQKSSKSIMKNLSGFLKMSKKCHKRSNICIDKIQRAKNQCHDDQDNEKCTPASNLPKSRTRSASQESEKSSTSEQKENILVEPSSLNNKAKRCLSKIGTGSHYPTVFRGKYRNEDNDENSTCNMFCFSRCFKSDQCDRISSGNCSLSDDVKENEPINRSEDSFTGSLKIEASKAIVSHGISNDCMYSGSESSGLSILIQASVNENEFKNVRLTPPTSICQCLSSTSSSSKNSSTQGIIYSKTTQINRQNIETCSKPPNIRKSTGSEFGCNCPWRRTWPKWSLTQQSNPHKLECTGTCRPARLGLCLPSKLEMSSRSPTVVPFKGNKKSSQNGPSNRLKRSPNAGKGITIRNENYCHPGKAVTINDKSPCSSKENIPIPVCKAERKIEIPRCQITQHNIGNSCEIRKYVSKPGSSSSSKKSIKTNDTSSGKRKIKSVISLCCNAKSETDNSKKPSIIGNLWEEGGIKLKLISNNSVKSIKSPGSSGKSSKICEISSCCTAKEKVNNIEDKLKTQCIKENLDEEQKSELALSLPRENPKCPSSTMSVCSKNLSQTNLKCGPENMSLICLPNGTCSPCFSNTKSGINKSVPPLPCDDSPETLTSNWTEDSTYGKSIVEELKQELLNTIKRERDIHYRYHCSHRNAPHIMIFPCHTSRVNANRIYGTDSVVCWAACPKPPSPF